MKMLGTIINKARNNFSDGRMTGLQNILEKLREILEKQ